MTVEAEIAAIIKRVLPTSTEVDQIVAHLMSNNVGVTCVMDLADLTLEMLPTHLPPLKAKQLLRAFNGVGEKPGELCEAGPSSSRGFQQYSEPTEPSQDTQGTFKFTVPWNSLPKELLDKLKDKEQTKKSADPAEIQKLKLSIACKLVSSYTSFKEINPGQKKHPGRKVYTNVTNQVFSKFRHCLQDVVNKKVVSDGTASFRRQLELCVENKLRSSGPTQTKSNVLRGKGLIGVIFDHYDPPVPTGSHEEQEGLKEHMKNLHKHCADLDWEDITDDLKKTYELQRCDIISVREKVLQDSEHNKENIGEDEDEPAVTALTSLKAMWPLLFTYPGLKDHHKRLTGRNIRGPMDGFIEKSLDSFIIFLTTESSANTNNTLLKLKLEKNNNSISISQKMMLFYKMLTNNFGEIDKMIVNTERTTHITEIVLGNPDVRIVAFDEDPFQANKFVCFADNTALVETTSFSDSLVALFELCFILDLNYPEMPLTFELLERYVLQMGIAETRIQKKGKQILVLTNSVKRTITSFEEFQKKLVDNSL